MKRKTTPLFVLTFVCFLCSCGKEDDILLEKIQYGPVSIVIETEADWDVGKPVMWTVSQGNKTLFRKNTVLFTTGDPKKIEFRIVDHKNGVFSIIDGRNPKEHLAFGDVKGREYWPVNANRFDQAVRRRMLRRIEMSANGKGKTGSHR